MAKQYVDVSGWDETPPPAKQYVDVSGWDDASSHKPEKSTITKVVDAVTAPFKAVASAYEKDQNKPTQPITAAEKYALAQNQHDMGRRSDEYMAKLKREAELEAGSQKREEQKKKRTAQIEESKKPALQQLADQFNPARPIMAIPTAIGSLVGGEETGKAIAKEFGGDYQYESGERTTTFADANPDYVLAESVIADPLNSLGAPVKAVGRAVNIAKIKKASPVGAKIHDAAQGIIDSTADSLGIDLPKPKATPDTLAKDEAIAKAIADEQGAPEIRANDTNVATTVEADKPINPHPEGTRPADSAPIIDTEAKIKAAQEEQAARVEKALEEGRARKLELEAQSAPKPIIEDLQAHPRYDELLDMRRNVTAKSAENKAVRESDRTLLHQNNGEGYETSVISANDVRNYDYDFELTRGDVMSIEKGKITPEIEAKLQKDLERLDSDPLYAKIETTPLRDSQVAKAAKVFGEDMAEANMKVIDEIAKAKRMSTDEWLKSTGYDLEDMRHTTYPQFKADVEEADALFQPAYHGTPHNVDKFTTEKIGTGEGAQAYGYGLYFAGDKKVAEFYRNKLAPSNTANDLNTQVAHIKLGEKSLSEFDIDPYDIPKFADSGDTQGFREYAKKKVDDWNALAHDETYKFPKYAQEKANAWNDVLNTKGELVDTSKGNLYKVDLKPEEDELLMWDKPLRNQSKKVQNIIPEIRMKLGDDFVEMIEDKLNLDLEDMSGYELHGVLKKYAEETPLIDGAHSNVAKDVADYLHSLGIRGIKYEDGMSRGTAVPNYNYVIFHNDDVEIIGHNGKMLNGQGDELFQDEKFVNGMVSIGVNTKGEMQSTIRLFESADFSTLIHESAHVVESQFDEIERAAYNKAFAHVAEGKARQEAFAEAFVKYLSEGVAPSDELVGAFEKFKNWLVDLWKVFSTRESEFKLTDEHIDFMRSIMGNKEAAGRVFAKGEREVVSAEAERVLYQLQHGDNSNATLDDLMRVLTDKENTEPIRTIKFDNDRWIEEFGLDHKGEDFIVRSRIDTEKPIVMKYGTLVKMVNKERHRFFTMIRPTLENPTIVLEHDGAIAFMKSFEDEAGHKHFYSVAKNHETDEWIISSAGVRSEGNLLNKIKEGNVVYLRGATPTTAKAEAVQMSGSINPESVRSLDGDSRSSESVLQKNSDVNELLQEDSRTPKESAGGFYSAAQRAIEKMPPKMGSEAFIKYLKNNGVKDDEILHSGIAKAVEGKTSITKGEIEGVFGNPVMESKTLEVPKYEKYSTEGGDNYREELTKISTEDDFKQWVEKYRYEDDPMWEEIKNDPAMYAQYQKVFLEEAPTKYRSSHWNEPNVLLHTRKQDTVIDGDKTLLVEEIQSDWHQDGRKMGYQDKAAFTPDDQKEMQRIEAQFDAKDRQYKLLFKKYGFDNEAVQRLNQERVELNKQWELYEDKRLASISKERVPQAPMSKTWHEFGMRQIIDEAVTKGYDRVAWVDGATQANRYSMSHSVDRLVYNKNYHVIEGYKDGKSVMYKNADEGELEALIGKEPAKRLMENEVHSGIHEIKGEALDIGGDGMKGFYDKILVDYAKKYTKKWGVTVEKKTLPNGVEVHSFPVNAKMKEEIAKNGQPLYVQGGGMLAGVGEDENGNVTFDPIMALAGIAGVSTLMSKSVRGAVSKLAGKAEHLSDATIQGMVRVTIKSVDKVTAGSITKSAEAIKKNDFVDFFTGHKIYSQKEYMKMREEALISVNKGMELAARTHTQFKELSSEAREAMYAYMTGEKNVVLTPELKRAADAFITKIDGIGQELVDDGILSKEAYEEWKGQYLHRKYTSKMKNLRDSFSGKGDFAVDGVKMRGKTWNATEDEYQELLKAGEIGKVSEGKIEVVKDADGGYKLRRDWTKEERKNMGEIRDVAYSIPETIGRMTQMIEFGNFLKSVSVKYVLPENEVVGKADIMLRKLGYTKLTGSRYGALNGKWVNSTIADDIARVGNDMIGGERGSIKEQIWEGYKSYVNAIKMSHTIYNPTAHVNNTLSNVVLQFGAGLNPIKTITYAKDGAIAAKHHTRWAELDAKRLLGLSDTEVDELTKLDGDADVILYRELSDIGLFGRSNLNDMLGNYMSPQTLVSADSKYQQFKRGAEALYQGEDNVMRFAAAKQLMNDGQWTQTTKGLEKVTMDAEEAVRVINAEITPDYTKPMSAAAKGLRDSGFVPFMSWIYHSTPVLMNQLKNHPTRFLAVLGTWYGMDLAFGINPFDEEDMPEKFDSQRMVINRDGDYVTGLRVSSMVPHAQIMPTNLYDTFAEPLFGGIPFTWAGHAKNYNFYFEQPHSRKEGPEGTYQRVTKAAMDILPTWDGLDKAWNLAESKLLPKESRRSNNVFEPKTPLQEAAGFLVNTQTYNLSRHRSELRREKIKGSKDMKNWKNKLEKVFQ